MAASSSEASLVEVVDSCALVVVVAALSSSPPHAALPSNSTAARSHVLRPLVRLASTIPCPLDPNGRPLTHGTPSWVREEEGGSETATCARSEEHTSELQSLMRISYAVF